MSSQLTFTAAQRALVEATSSTYVEACPGAGKTQAIVQRFIERPGADTRRGVALLSFTNAAVEVARARCVARPELLRVPNFVGTIDGFINRFLVGPMFVEQTGRAATFRDTWQNVAGSTFGVQHVRGQFQLDWFEFDIEGSATFTIGRVPGDRRHSLKDLEAWKLAKIQAEASLRWKRNIARGVLDAVAARVHVKCYLQYAELRNALCELLSGRFSEVIVDEVQDCCDEDVVVLQLVLDAGVRLIMVGDPDQAIYGFRGASSASLASLREAVTVGERLNGNFRSSPAICAVVDSLRTGNSTDEPVGVHASTEHAVQLVEYKALKQARRRIAEVVALFGLTIDDVVVLSHGQSKARACAGAPAPVKFSESKLVVLATAICTIQDEATAPRERVDAVGRLERMLQQLAPATSRELSEADFLQTLGLSGRQFRERTLRLASSLDPPYASAPSTFKSQLASQTEAQRVLGWSTNGLRIPPNDSWPDVPAVPSDCLSYSTVHGYKGLEAPAVALVMPERPTRATDDEDGIALWSSGGHGEARNVLYVGASRAERLLLLVVHETQYAAVRTILDRDRVAYEARVDGPATAQITS